jgi:hypothetical protein
MKKATLTKPRYLKAISRLAKLGADRIWTIGDGQRAFETKFAHPFVKNLRDGGLVRKLPGKTNRYLLTKTGFKAAAAK